MRVIVFTNNANDAQIGFKLLNAVEASPVLAWISRLFTHFVYSTSQQGEQVYMYQILLLRWYFKAFGLRGAGRKNTELSVRYVCSKHPVGTTGRVSVMY